MSTPEIDPNTAASMLEDADFADEHTKPTHSDEPAPEGSDESAPVGTARRYDSTNKYGPAEAITPR